MKIHYAEDPRGLKPVVTLCGYDTNGDEDHVWIFGIDDVDCQECLELYENKDDKKVVIHFENVDDEILCGAKHDEYNAKTGELSQVTCQECCDKYLGVDRPKRSKIKDEYTMTNKQLQKAINCAKWRHPFGSVTPAIQEHLEALLEIQLQRAKEKK